MARSAHRRSGRTLLLTTIAALVALLVLAGSSGAMTRGSGADPWIASDLADYAPGSTVHLTGGNWQPGEEVRILTNDTVGNTWSQSDTVTADVSGAIADDVVLPSYFISDYTVTATAASGTATTTFTDAVNYQFLGKDGLAHTPPTSPEEDFGSVTSGSTLSATCSTGLTAKATGLGGGQSTSYAISYVSGYGDNATLSSPGSRTQINPASGTFVGNGSICTSLSISTTGLVAGTYHGELQMRNTGGATATTDFYFFKFAVTQVQQATSISAVSGSGTYGGTATLTAMLKAGTTPLSGKSISFTINGSAAGSATTDASGVATLSGASLSGINAGTGTVGASFAGDSSYTGSSGSGSLTVAKASSTTVVSCPASVTYDGSAKTPCSANATGAGGLNQALTVTYSNNTAAGTATASASYGGDANHNGSSDSKTFTIATAPSTTTVSCPGTSITYDGSAKTPCTATVTGAGGLNQTLTVGYSSNTDAGTATASAVYAGDANHGGSSDSKTFTIAKASSTTTVNCPASVTYDGSAKTPCSANVTGIGGLNQAVAVNYSNNTGAGTATASATFTGDSNHDGSSDSKTFTIAKADQTITFSAPFSATYDQTFQVHPTTDSGLTVSLGGTAGVCSVTPDALQLGVFDVTMLAGTGTCALTASQPGDANYDAATSVTRNVAAAKANQSITFDALADKTFGDADFGVSASASSGLAVSFAASGDCSVSGSTVHIGGAGNCTITASQDGNGNYNAATDLARSFAIGKAPSTVSVSCTSGPFTYTGSAHTPCSANVTGAGGLGHSLSVSYSDNVNAGTATASASYAGDDNHSGDSSSATFAIEKASSTVAVTCPDSRTYTGSAIEPCTAKATGAGGLNEDLTVSYADNTNGGTATASASFGGDANHAGSSGSGTFSIDKAPSTVTLSCPDSRTYTGGAIEPCTAKATGAGGLDATLTVSYSDNVNAGTATASANYGGDGNHNGDNGSNTFTIEKAPSTVVVTCPDSRTYMGSAIEPCSAKATGAGGLDADLVVSYGDNVNAGTATASASYGGDANHDGDSGSASFTIEKAPSAVAVTCPDSRTYTGSPIEPCTAKATGAGGLNEDLTVSYAGNVNAGSATASASFDGDANHTGSSNTGDFTIEKAPSTVSVSCPDSRTYTGSAIEPCSANATGAGGLDETLTVSYADNVNTGTATASAAYAGDANHEGDSSSKTFTIEKAPSIVTVSCAAGPFAYTGSSHTPCSAKATGAGGLDETLTVSYADNVDAGTATASAAYDGDANHLGDSSSETFTIGKAPSSVAVTCPDARTYTGSAIEPCSAKAAGADGLSTDLTVSYSANVNAGTATASAAYAGDANHHGNSSSETFRIEKAPSSVAVTCAAGPFIYTGSTHTPCSAKATGAGGLDVTLTVSYSDNVNAGTATASAAYAGDANHHGDSSSETFTIEKAASTVTVTCPDSRTYTGSAIEPCSAKATGAGGLNQPLTVSYSDNVNAGTASASASYDGDDNHTGSSNSGNFTIAKAPSTVTVSCNAGPFTYTGSAHMPCSAKATGAGGLDVTLAVTYADNINAGTATASAAYDGDHNHLGDSGSKTFTIDKAPSTVAVSCTAGPFTYSGSPHTPCSGNVTGAGGLDQSLPVSYSDNVGAGTANASASYGGDANHLGDSASKTFTIDKAPSHVAVTCPDSRTYTGSAIEPCTARATGAGGLDAAIAVSYASNVNAGTATASATYGGDPNHLGDSGSSTFTIAKAPSTVTVSCAAGPFTFNGSPQTPCSAKATGAGGLDVSLTVSYSDNVNAGTATASASYGGDANHLGDSSSKTFTIGKATPTVSVNWTAWTFDGTAHPASGSVTGVGGAALGTPSFTYYSGTGTSGTPLAGAPSGVGTYTVLAEFAGNPNYTAASKTKTVGVLYRWDGFLQPINDTAHQGGFESFFKLGSTVPAKFQLKKADGTVVQAGVLPTFSRSTTPVSCDTQIAPEALGTDAGFTGSTFRWDSGQYIYNWSTKGLKAGEYRIYATLEDGSKQYVDICLQ